MMSDVNAVFGRELRRLRHQHHLTQRELGEEAGVSPKTISSAELGRKGPTLWTAVMLARALGTGLDAMTESAP